MLLVIIFALLHLYKYDFFPGHVAHLSVRLPPLFPCTAQTGCAFSQIILLANELFPVLLVLLKQIG